MAAKRKPFAQPHVALIIETSKIYGREILSGITEYMRLHGPWSIFATERGQDDPDPPWLSTWSGDGILTRSVNLDLCKAAQGAGIPVVSLRHLTERPPFPTVFPNQYTIAIRVAEHLLERGIRNFGYVGVPGNKGWERLRREEFIRVIHERGFANIALRSILAEPNLSWERQQEQIGKWVESLPKPVGIMVSHDTQGIQLLDACRRRGVRVPDDVAVVSVDNDPVLCEIASPPLSSLDQNVRKIGFEAAALLDRLMTGQRVDPSNFFFEPGEVVTRQSSDIISVSDPRLANAIKFVRQNACNGVDVDAVARAAGMSRRLLEQKFAEVIGRTPLEEIHVSQLRRVKQLLLETDYPLSQIAELSGFNYQEYLVRFFKRYTGTTPGKYRLQNRFNNTSSMVPAEEIKR
jgi:LacI family transcriptional regulator